jgi:MFS transporter, DHA1 family, tetracycline resistance protein
MTETLETPKGRSPLLAIFLTIFIDLIGFSILIPVFPLLIGTAQSQAYRVTPLSWSPASGLIMLGWLQAIYPLCIFLAAPILGQLSDRVGRRPVLALSIAGTSIGYIIFAVGISTKNLPLLFFGRALDGITGGNLAVAQAAIGDVSTNENRAKNFGLIGAAFGLGFILGPYIGGRLSAPGVSFYGLFTTPKWFGATTPFWFAAALAGLNALFVFLTLPETLTHRSDRKVTLSASVRNVASGFASERLRIVLSTGFLWTCGFTFFTTFFGIYVANKFGFSQSKTGDFFAIVGIFIAITQGAIVGVIAKKMQDYRVLRFAILLQAAALVGYFAVTKSVLLYACIPGLALFQGLTQANLSSLVSRSAELGRQGEAMGIYSSVSSLAQVPAAILVGYIAGSASSNTPLVVAAALTALAGFLFIVLFRPKFVETNATAQSMAAAH